MKTISAIVIIAAFAVVTLFMFYISGQLFGWFPLLIAFPAGLLYVLLMHWRRTKA